MSHATIRSLLEKAGYGVDGIEFSLHEFKEIESDGKSAAAVTLSYVTAQGAKNRFDLDVVYKLNTDSAEIESPISEATKIRAATIENIVADKLSASHRFRSGNTRMKDYDDLWRIARSGTKVDPIKLAKLIKERSAEGPLDLAWISPEMESAWRTHRSRYQDLPEKLEVLFAEVNTWLEEHAS